MTAHASSPLARQQNIKVIRNFGLPYRCSWLCALSAQEPASTPVNPPGLANPPSPANPPAREPSRRVESGATLASRTRISPPRSKAWSLNDATGQPLRRARVALNARDAGLGPPAPRPMRKAISCCATFPRAPTASPLRAMDSSPVRSRSPADYACPRSFRLTPARRSPTSPSACVLGRCCPAACGMAMANSASAFRSQVYRTDHVRARSAYSLAATAYGQRSRRISHLRPGPRSLPRRRFVQSSGQSELSRAANRRHTRPRIARDRLHDHVLSQH